MPRIAPAALRAEAAAAYLGGISVNTLRDLPGLPRVQLTERVVVWRRADLDAWLAARPRIGAPSDEIDNPWDAECAPKASASR